MSLATFEAFKPFRNIWHGFTLRTSACDKQIRSAEQSLSPHSISASDMVQAEQPHGNRVGKAGCELKGQIIPGVDALITNEPEVVLVIRTADCGAVYFFDPVHQAIGLAHSGKKGTEKNITASVVEEMRNHFGTRPEHLISILGPCIRPPFYEVDFADTIASQMTKLGIEQFTDCGDNTGSDPTRFYSYRMEKGQTGRHYAFIGLRPENSTEPKSLYRQE